MARQETSGLNKMAPLTEYLLKERESWTTALSLTEKEQNALRKIPSLRKSYSLYLRVVLQKGVDEVGDDDE
jgi:hypothetical protein